MTVIIGATSNVSSSQFPNGGIISMQYNYSPQVQRLWQLGTFTPYDSFINRTLNIQLTVYGTRSDGSGGSEVMLLDPSTTCVNTNGTTMTVNLASCAAVPIAPFADIMYVTSYSYQKDNFGFGQENWSFTGAPIHSNLELEAVMLRGISEGTIAVGPNYMTSAQMGVVVNESGSNDLLGNPINAESGSVQAGTASFGTLDTERYVIATSVGASMGLNTAVDGLVGAASISVPMTPVYL